MQANLEKINSVDISLYLTDTEAGEVFGHINQYIYLRGVRAICEKLNKQQLSIQIKQVRVFPVARWLGITSLQLTIKMQLNDIQSFSHFNRRVEKERRFKNETVSGLKLLDSKNKGDKIIESLLTLSNNTNIFAEEKYDCYQIFEFHSWVFHFVYKNAP